LQHISHDTDTFILHGGLLVSIDEAGDKHDVIFVIMPFFINHMPKY